jgi:hypothetical protein
MDLRFQTLVAVHVGSVTLTVGQTSALVPLYEIEPYSKELSQRTAVDTTA